MTVAVRISTTLDVLLGNILRQVQTAYPASYLSIQPHPIINPPSDTYVCVVPGPEPVCDLPAFAGGGNNLTTFNSQILCVIWCRLALDQVQRADIYLTDQSLGAIAAFNAVLNALTMYEPFDENGNLLLAQPMRPAKARMPLPTNVPGWGHLVLAFDIKWKQEITGMLPYVA